MDDPQTLDALFQRAVSAIDALPAYSPNGRSIVFVSDRTAKDNREFFVMSASGAAQRRLLRDPNRWDMSPDWGKSAGRHGCTITGTINDDDLIGTPRRDVICGLGGSDRIRGLGGNDRLVGGAGADRLEGGSGADTLDARDRRRDVLVGGPGRDTAIADRRLDRLTGVERRR